MYDGIRLLGLGFGGFSLPRSDSDVEAQERVLVKRRVQFSSTHSRVANCLQRKDRLKPNGETTHLQDESDGGSETDAEVEAEIFFSIKKRGPYRYHDHGQHPYHSVIVILRVALIYQRRCLAGFIPTGGEGMTPFHCALQSKVQNCCNSHRPSNL